MDVTAKAPRKRCLCLFWVYWFESKCLYIGGMYDGRGQRIVSVPQSSLVVGSKQVFPYPVDYEDDGKTALALTIREANGDDITSLEWNGDTVLTGPIADPGGPGAAILMAQLAAAAVSAGFTARFSGNTAYFMRDDGPRLGGYEDPVLVMSGASSIVTAVPVRSVIQDLRDDPVPADVASLLPHHVLANAFDPDGGSIFESHGQSIARGSYVLNLATYTVHKVGTKTKAKGGPRTVPRIEWEGWKLRTRFEPSPLTLDWFSLDSITGGPTEWGEEHPVLQLPAARASGRVVNLDTVDPAYINGVQINPGEFHEFDCIREPFIVTPSPTGCRVEWDYEMEDS